MASLAVPLIEGVVVRVLAALGVGVVAGAAGEAAKEQARKRQDEADKAKSTPISRTDATTKERKKCKDCPPDKGQKIIRNHKWGPEVVAYQVRICGLPFGDGWITEWNFSGIDFDGFDSGQCLLKEAKSTYDQFFNMWKEFDYPFQGKIFEKMTDDAVKQNNVAIPKPPVQLHWYFMQPVSFRYMQKILQVATPQIEVIYQP